MGMLCVICSGIVVVSKSENNSRLKLTIDGVDDMEVGQENFSVILPGRRGSVSLSRREVETLRLILLGKTVVGIANVFSISPRTVENYLNALKKKFGCISKVDLVEYALSMDFYDKLNLFAD